jgi:hypothetical protein
LGDPKNTYVYELRVYQPTPTSTPKLVTITHNNSGGQVLAYNGVGWSLFAPAGFGKPRNVDMWQAIQFGSDFYVGTFKNNFGPAQEVSRDQGAELWRYDSLTRRWAAETTNGFGTPGNTGIRVILPWQGALYVGTLNDATGCEVWKGTPR